MDFDKVGFCILTSAYIFLSTIKTLELYKKRTEKKRKKKKPLLIKQDENENVDFKPLAEAPGETFKNIKRIINYCVSFNSSFIIIGSLSESYLYGVRMVINIVSVTLGYLYAFFIVQPFMYSLDEDIKTPYQYFEKRYNSKLIRSVSSFFGMLFYFSFLTLYLWGCTILLSTLIPQIPYWLASLIIGIYSLIGSTIGGFTQTTITNVVQFIILIVGLLTAIVLTIQTSKNSISELWEFASKNNRTRFIEIDTDFRTRYTVVNQLVSLPIPWCSIHSLLLPNFMRYRAVKGKARSRFLVVSNFPFMVLVNGLTLIGGGIVCFLYFYGCDPLKSGSILNKNATGAYWLYSILSEHVPSFCGILFSSIICYSVIQHSMGISLCANTLVEETINPLYKFKLKDKKIKSLKLYITVLLGMLSILYSISFQFVKNTMLALFFLFNNTTNSPILGLFLLSAFNPFANAFGAITAFLLNLGINYWLGAGSFLFSHLKNQEFSTSDVLCEDKKRFSNLTSSSLNSNNFNYYPENEVLFYLYSIAPIWYCLFSVLFMCIFGTLLSFLYSYFRSGSHDTDSYYREIRKRYLFFYS